MLKIWFDNNQSSSLCLASIFKPRPIKTNNMSLSHLQNRFKSNSQRCSIFLHLLKFSNSYIIIIMYHTINVLTPLFVYM